MFLSVEDVEILPLLSTGPCRFGLVESEMSELEVVFTLEKVKLCFSFGSEALSMPSFLVAEEAPIEGKKAFNLVLSHIARHQLIMFDPGSQKFKQTSSAPRS